MSQSQYFGTFIFVGKNPPPGAEIVTRRVPPKPTNLTGKDDVPEDAPCDVIEVEDVRDKDVEEVLVLHTPLMRGEAAWKRFIGAGIGKELWDACSNGVIYRVDPGRTDERTSKKGGVPPRPAAQRMAPAKGVKKGAKKSVKKTAKKAKEAAAKSPKAASKLPARKVAKKARKNKGLKKSKKPTQTLARGGVPPKNND